MTIAAGVRLGPYEIISQLGAGGMGEVLRAHDSRLDREIALKLLPADFANDEDRLRRFEQEGKATSALNHLNILTVYEVFPVLNSKADENNPLISANGRWIACLSDESGYSEL